MKRREFVKTATILGATLPFWEIQAGATSVPASKSEIFSFSKLFQFLDYDELAAVFKESGLDGIDLTVRKGGHVLPENVEKDLPKAVKAAQKQGISIPAITTDILDVDDPLTERVLKTASDNGVKYYRMGYYDYDYQKTILANLDIIKSKMERVAEMNGKYSLWGGYQNHWGARFGGSPWEIWAVIKDMDPKKIGCVYDVLHGIVEGTQSWVNALRLITPFASIRYIKDFYFIATQKHAEPHLCPLGEGMVDFKTFFRICRELGIYTPFCLHIEYPLFNDDEKNLPHIDKYKKALAIMKRDTDKLKSLMAENGVS